MSVFRTIMKKTLSGSVSAIKSSAESINNKAEKLNLNSKIEKIGLRTTAEGHVYDVIDAIAGLTEKRTPDGSMLDRKLSRSGKMVGLGIGVYGTASSAINQQNMNDIGTSDGKIYAANPSIKSYMQKPAPPPDLSAGATGDLVFALNDNRQTGFLG